MKNLNVCDAQKAQSFELNVGGKRLKSINQEIFNATINGVNTQVTKLEVSSALESLVITLPIAGHWKLGKEKDCMNFTPREGTCAEFKIVFV